MVVSLGLREISEQKMSSLFDIVIIIITTNNGVRFIRTATVTIRIPRTMLIKSKILVTDDNNNSSNYTICKNK